jgi:molybdate transport system ATP-binding protein
MLPMSSAGTRYLEVRLAHLSLQRGGRNVLKGISWTIRPGERWVLAGANGAGKTQLLKLVAGVVWPKAAARATRHYLLGRQVNSTPFGIKDDIAYLGAERHDKYQRYGWNMPVERIVGTGLYRTDIPLDALSVADRRRIRRTLERLAVAHLAPRRLLSLSYGERRLILLARALVSRPRLLLLDEVLNGLDEINRARLLRWLGRQTGRLPWVIATHRIEDVPPGATHALVLSGGRIVYRGALRGAPLTRWLAARARRASPAASARRAARPGGRSLVRLSNARVYLEQRRVLEGISLTVRAGEFWLVHGRNGSGKTTLLRTLYGDHGVAVGGAIERAGVGPGVALEVFKKRVGLVAPHLQADHPAQLTVAEVVQSGRHASVGLNDAPSAADRSAARRTLALFALTRLATRTLGELSYGQSRRVLFARAWVREPELLLLDEPLAGVDSPTRRALLERVLALAAGGSAVVVSAHRAGDWLRCASHELELARGRALYCGPIRPILERRRRVAGAAR